MRVTLSDEEISIIIHQIDVVHSIAKQAYRDKNIKTYMETFTTDVEYEQVDGRMIGYEKLESQVRDQFASVRDVDSSYERESFEADSDKVIEILTQKAWATVVAFGFIKRTWSIVRRGSYSWVKTENGWKIERVKILAERIK